MNNNSSQPSIQQTVAYWNKSTDFYSKFDSTLQCFYYSLINLLKLPQSHNILQIGCGRCLLVPYVLQLKKKQTKYIATDISQKMIQSAYQQLLTHFNNYDSTITFEQWIKQNNLQLKVANGQQPINQPYKFDRIICNMVIMLTEDAQKMLINMYNEGQEGCLLGISTWGIKQNNLYHTLMGEAVRKNGLQIEIKRDNYYLYEELGALAVKVGWKVRLKWDQISPYPYITAESVRQHSKRSISNMNFTQQQKNKVHKTFMEQLHKNFAIYKGINFSAQMYILQK